MIETGGDGMSSSRRDLVLSGFFPPVRRWKKRESTRSGRYRHQYTDAFGWGAGALDVALGAGTEGPGGEIPA